MIIDYMSDVSLHRVVTDNVDLRGLDPRIVPRSNIN